MPLLSAKLRFHCALYAAFLGLRRGTFSEISTKLPTQPAAPGKLRIHFWTPTDTAGANVIVHDVMPSLTRLARELAPGFEIQAASDQIQECRPNEGGSVHIFRYTVNFYWNTDSF